MKDVKKLIHLGVDGIISDIPMIYLNYNKTTLTKMERVVEY